MKKTNLVLFPVLAALLLAGCTSTPKKKKKTSSGAQTSQKTSSGKTTSGGGATSKTTSQGGGTSATPTPSGDSTFNLTPGTHTTVIDFVTNYSQYKSDFAGYVEASTGLVTGSLGGLAVNSVHCFVSSYSGSGYLMMQNNKSQTDWTSTHGVAFFGNTASLGSISEISFTPGSSASTAAVYNVAILDSAVTAEGGSSAGTSFTGSGGKVTGSGGFFCITATNAAKNGQIGTLTVTYTIS